MQFVCVANIDYQNDLYKLTLFIVLHTLILQHLTLPKTPIFIGLKFCCLLVEFSINCLLIERLEHGIRYGDFSVLYI